MHYSLISDGEHPARQQYLAAVTPDFFTVLGIPLHRGRMPAAGRPEILVSYNYWKSIYESNEKILGRVLKLNGVEFTVVGVAPREYFGGYQ